MNKRTRRAVLIQGIGEYLAIVTPVITEIFNEMPSTLTTIGPFIHWMISEQIETLHNVNVRAHNHRVGTFHQPYYALKRRLVQQGLDLDVLTRHYIRCPKIYGDFEIEISYIAGLDLVFTYYCDVLEYPHTDTFIHEKPDGTKTAFAYRH